MKIRNTNNAANQLAGIGSINGHNRVQPPVTRSTKIGVAVEQEGINKAIAVEITVPVRRSSKGSRRVAKLNLNGQQARALFAELQNFFNYSNQNNH